MKKLTLLAVAIAMVACFSACNCNQKAATQEVVATAENMKTAITGESNASAKYALICAEALNQGEAGIAAMFAAASAAEAIHVQNHTLVLNELGETIEVVAEPQIGVNLEELMQGAIEGETYEFTEMYPPMMEQAGKEELTDALRTLTYAKKAEETHAKRYAETLELFKSGKSNEIAKIWYVCPVCGNLFNTFEGYEICAICGAHKNTFTPFEL